MCIRKQKGCHFVVIPRLKQPKNNPNNDSLLLANYLILNNSMVEMAGIEPASPCQVLPPKKYSVRTCS